MDPAATAIAGIDIDGVLSDPTHRLHHLERRPKNWRGFFAEAHLDSPLPEGIARVQALAAEGVGIIYVSGRPEYLRRATQEWLARHGLPQAAILLRPRGDFRPAPILKAEIYSRLAEESQLRVILDDDARVVAHLQELGLPVELADWYQPDQVDAAALSEAQDQKGRT